MIEVDENIAFWQPSSAGDAWLHMYLLHQAFVMTALPVINIA
jgi:hypothetical protein